MTTKKKKIQGGLEDQPNNPGPGGASTSSTSTDPPDRISELPVEILHRILGFLEMDECLIGTSLVSTKWRNLWKSVSILKFPHSKVFSGGGALKYQNFVDHVLRLRDSQASKIEIFSYFCDDFTPREDYDLLERIHNLILSAAVNQGAQEIIIDGTFYCQSDNGNGLTFVMETGMVDESTLFAIKLLKGVGSTAAHLTLPGIEILHHILGILDMDEFLIGTSLVSTKWRNLWKSVSTLNFSLCRPPSRLGGSVELVSFVDHVLRLRNSVASKIQIFNYSAYTLRDDYGFLKSLHKFIVTAVVNQGAQEILVMESYSVQSGKMIHFNPSIFTSRLLRKFIFRLHNGHFLIQFPRSMCCATQLTHLSLDGIILPEGDDDSSNDAAADQLHLVCPVLETFYLNSCSSEHLKVLDISAPRLNTLHITMRFRGSDYLGGCRLEIRTPNLTSLVYSGCVYDDCFTENLPLLDFANLSFTKETGMTEKTSSFAIKLLKGLTTAKDLVLEGFEVFLQDTLKVLLTPFTSLRTLELKSSCKISSIQGMVHILSSCNSLEKFVWEVDEYVKVEGDEHSMLPQCRLSHLKHVHIKSLHGHENEIEFVKFLLKSSVVLEDLMINTTKNFPKSLNKENLKQFIEEEVSVRRSIKLQILEEES